MNAHAFLPPSGADAWVPCALWPTMNARYPSDSTEESEEGRAAHWVVEERAWGAVHKEGDRAPNGYLVTQEMLDGADLWLSAIRPVLGLVLHVEETLAALPDAPENWGTPDLWTFSAPHLDVYDYKFGHGYVAVEENWQLINYALLVLGQLQVPDDREVLVRLHVVQPRCYDAEPHRTWTVVASDLRAHANILHAAVVASRDPLPKARTGTHCKHCPGRHACAVLQRDGFSSMDEAFRTLPQELPPEALAVEMSMVERALERLRARASGLQTACLALAREGKLPGWQIERGRSTERWLKSPAEVLAFADQLGIDISKPDVPMTPGQTRKAGMPDAIVALLTERTPGPEKLTRAPDLKTVFNRTTP